MEEFVQAYVALRDARDDVKERHKAELAEITSALEDLELVLMSKLNELGVESVRTASGTVYKSKWTSVKVDDFEAVVNFIKESDRFDLLERRVNKTVALEIGDVPGTSTDSGYNVNIRRK